MNSDMMGGGMMWAMGIVWLLVIVLLVLSIAALVKYVFPGNRKGTKRTGSGPDTDQGKE